jgi:very-short-patch-repair endonuclease
MKSLSPGAREKIEGSIDTLFDNVMMRLLGPWGKKKTILFSSKGESTLAHLFVQSLRNREPTPPEKDMLKGLLSTAASYINALKERTKGNVIDKLDAQVKSGKQLEKEEVRKIVTDEMVKSRNHMKLIAEAESTKTRNSGAAMDILKVGASIGTTDPYCYFVVVHDNVTCLEISEEILTKNGPKKSGDIQTGDALLNPSLIKPTSRSNRKYRTVEFAEKEVVELIELDFGSFQIKCTKDHPILVKLPNCTYRSRSSGRELIKYEFIEAQYLNENHDVIDIKTASMRSIGKLSAVRDYVKNLGFDSNFYFWKKNLSDILNIFDSNPDWDLWARKTYKISQNDFHSHFIPVLNLYRPGARIPDRGVKNNTFNAKYIQKKSEAIKKHNIDTYEHLGGDKWIIQQACSGKNSQTISREQNISISFIRKQIKKLGLISNAKARGGRANWKKNRKMLHEMIKNKSTAHLKKKTSKPEMKVFDIIKNEYADAISQYNATNRITVDILIPSKVLVIEYDGSGHDMMEKINGRNQKSVDFARDKILRSKGFNVLRIESKKDVIDRDKIITAIETFEGGFQRCILS